jgi:hydroxyacylglutathione hydrolase/adenylyltransferase/sulfurtransferase
VIGGKPSGDASRRESAASLFDAMPETSELSIDPQRLADWIAEDPQLQVVDVREPYERDAGHIADTLHIEMNRLSSEAAKLDSDRPVVFYCRVGARSTMAAQALRAAGFDAYSMSGGLLRWDREGRPLSPYGGSVADH